jgi:Holliday junction resolvase RusA-like endonuclease
VLLFSATFPIEPVPWQRVTPFKGRMIQSEKTRVYERDLGQLARYKMGPLAPFDQPLSVKLTFRLEQPHRFRNRPHPDVICDIDNLEKSTLDALNKIVWVDDKRIVHVEKKKEWSKGSGSLYLEVYTYE